MLVIPKTYRSIVLLHEYGQFPFIASNVCGQLVVFVGLTSCEISLKVGVEASTVDWVASRKWVSVTEAALGLKLSPINSLI